MLDSRELVDQIKGSFRRALYQAENKRVYNLIFYIITQFKKRKFIWISIYEFNKYFHINKINLKHITTSEINVYFFFFFVYHLANI